MWAPENGHAIREQLQPKRQTERPPSVHAPPTHCARPSYQEARKTHINFAYHRACHPTTTTLHTRRHQAEFRPHLARCTTAAQRAPNCPKRRHLRTLAAHEVDYPTAYSNPLTTFAHHRACHPTTTTLHARRRQAEFRPHLARRTTAAQRAPNCPNAPSKRPCAAQTAYPTPTPSGADTGRRSGHPPRGRAHPVAWSLTAWAPEIVYAIRKQRRPK